MSELKSFQLSTIILATLCCSVRSQSDFTYSGNMGPDHWSEHFNQCAGKHQSPINIKVLDVVNRTYSKIVYKEFDKLPLEASMVNNGHTVLVQMAYAGAVPSVSGGPLEGKGTYQFQQLHFHWGEDNAVGSEDLINDVAYPMELHVVFRNSKYASFEEAAKQGDGITVLAAFYEVGNYTSMEYDHLTNFLRLVYEPHSNVTLTQPINLFSMLSQDLSKYYTYIGSLTTPPCSEDVIWIDYINPIVISTEMIDRFRYLKTFDGSSLKHNFRPVQPLNNRQVYRVASAMSGEAAKNVTQSGAGSANSSVLSLTSVLILYLTLALLNFKMLFHQLF